MARSPVRTASTRCPKRTKAFLFETSRKRLPPLLWPALAGAALFGIYLAWLFLADDRSPEDWWRQEVEPALVRMREAESRGDWEVAEGACREAIGKARDRGRDFGSRLGELKARLRGFEGRAERERKAAAAADDFEKRSREVQDGSGVDPAVRYRRVRALAREGRDLAEIWAGTAAVARLRRAVESLEAEPPPPAPSRESWREAKASVDAAVLGREFGEAMRRLSAFEGSGAPEAERRMAAAYRVVVDSHAGEYYRDRYGRGRTPEGLIREMGREALSARIREDLRRLEGTGWERPLREKFGSLSE